MLIKGIRSFDPENKHVIAFFKPLTLIVGPNGAGKTVHTQNLSLSLYSSFVRSLKSLLKGLILTCFSVSDRRPLSNALSLRAPGSCLPTPARATASSTTPRSKHLRSKGSFDILELAGCVYYSRNDPFDRFWGRRRLRGRSSSGSRLLLARMWCAYALSSLLRKHLRWSSKLLRVYSRLSTPSLRRFCSFSTLKFV